MSRPSSRTDPEGARRRELARIHVGRKALGMDEDAYRGLLSSVAGRRSAGALDRRGRGLVLDEMRRLGAFGKGGGGRSGGRSGRALVRKVHAQLAALDLPVTYAVAILKRQRGDDAPASLEWAGDEALRGVISALTRHQERQRVAQ